MINFLDQRRFLVNKRSFELTDEGIFVRINEMTRSSETFVGFENIGVKRIRSKERKRGWLIATFIFFILSMGLLIYEKTGGQTEKNAFIVYLILAAISGSVFFITSKNLIYLVTSDNNNAIGFYNNNPSKQEFEAFIDLVKTVRKAVLGGKYGELTKLIPYEQQLETLQWLNRIDVLNKDEYDNKVGELKLLFNPDRPIIGFQIRKE